MAINIGYIEATCDDSNVVVRIYYDAEYVPVGDDQPLINGPRGYCLDMTNKTGRLAKTVLSLTDGSSLPVFIQRGDPVTTGPPAGRSRTAAQVAADFGWTTRGSVGNLQLGCGG